MRNKLHYFIALFISAALATVPWSNCSDVNMLYMPSCRALLVLGAEFQTYRQDIKKLPQQASLSMRDTQKLQEDWFKYGVRLTQISEKCTRFTEGLALLPELKLNKDLNALSTEFKIILDLHCKIYQNIGTDRSGEEFDIMPKLKEIIDDFDKYNRHLNTLEHIMQNIQSKIGNIGNTIPVKGPAVTVTFYI